MEIFEATCNDGVVSIYNDDGELVESSDSILTLSATMEDSEGYVLVGSNKSIYIADGVGKFLQVLSDGFKNATTVTAPVADTESGGSTVNNVVPKEAFDSIAETLDAQIKE